MEWPLLAAVPEDQLREVLAIARRRSFAEGEVVFHQNDPADTLHLIRSGHVAVRIDAGRGDSVIAAILGPGEMFGELALLDPDALRSATIVAMEATETLSVHQLDFGRLRRQTPAAAEVLIALLSAQVRRLSQHLVEALYVPADKRVLRRVVDMARVYASEEDGGEVVVPLTQDHLADLAGTSRITVNRTLRGEQERGTLELARGRTVIRDVEAIEARAFGRPVSRPRPAG
jgi:CRP/FNR family cyclic AMP-dependent transcriptional regulator